MLPYSSTLPSTYTDTKLLLHRCQYREIVIDSTQVIDHWPPDRGERMHASRISFSRDRPQKSLSCSLTCTPFCPVLCCMPCFYMEKLERLGIGWKLKLVFFNILSWKLKPIPFYRTQEWNILPRNFMALIVLLLISSLNVWTPNSLNKIYIEP